MPRVLGGAAAHVAEDEILEVDGLDPPTRIEYRLGAADEEGALTVGVSRFDNRLATR